MTTLLEQVSSAVSEIEAAATKAKQFVEVSGVIQTEAGPRDSMPLLIEKLNAEAAKTETGENRAAANIAKSLAQQAEYNAQNHANNAAASRDAAIIGAGLYVSESVGRAAVADGVAFKVQGTGDIAAYEYRRVNASSSTLIATYPSKKAYDKISKGYSLSKQYPNLHNDPLFEDAELNWPTTSIYEVVTYNNRKCIHVLPGGTGYSKIYEPSKLGSNKVSVSLRIEGKSTGSSSGGRILLLQYSSLSTSSTYELGRQTYNFNQQSISEPTTISFDNIDVIAGCVAICVYVDASNGNDFYISEFIIAGGDESAFRHNVNITNLWPEPAYSDASSIGGGASVSIENDLYTLSISNATTSSYVIAANSIGILSAGEQLSFGCDVYSPTHDAAQIEVVFFDDNGAEISRKQKDNDTTVLSWKPIKIAFQVPTGTRKLEFRLNLRYQSDVAGVQTAKFRNTVVKSRSNMIDDKFGGYFDAKNKAVKTSVLNNKNLITKLIDSRSGEFSSPNVCADPLFLSYVYNSGPCSIEFLNGRRCLKVSSGEVSSSLIDRNKIDGDKFSCGFTIVKSTRDFGRILIMQLDATGQQISVNEPYRLTKTIQKSIPDTAKEDVSFVGITISQVCKYIQFYFDSGTGNELWITDPWVRVGVADTFVPQMPKIPNYWPDPYFIGNKISSLTSDQGGVVERNDDNGSAVLKFTITDSLVVRRYYADSIGFLTANANPWLSVKVKSDAIDCAEVGVLYFDSDGNEITRQVIKNKSSDLESWQSINFRLSVPESCSLIQFRFVGWNNSAGTVAYFKDVTLTEYPVSAAWQTFNLNDELTAQKQSKNKVFIGHDGVDTNSGTYISPVKTFKRASAILGGCGTVIYKAGDYDVTSIIDMAAAENVEIYAEKLGYVRFILGYKIQNQFTLVSGKTKVWCVDCEIKPNKFMFEHLTPEGEIPASERHPLHRGKTHRLPSHRLRKAQSIDAIESSSSALWYYDSATSKLYISTVSNDDPNLHEYYIPRGPAITGGSAGKRIKVSGIHAWYGHFNLSNFDYYEASDLFAMGANAAGAIMRDQSRGIEYRNEACASDNDGTNMHNPYLSASITQGGTIPAASTIIAFDNYCHDNYDDGDSCHERCEGQYIGGLMEYNGDRGIATSYGAHVTAIGVTASKNGQEYKGVQTVSAGEGFGALGNTSPTEGGKGTDMICINCVSIDNKVGFGALNSNCTLIAEQCRTKDCETAYSSSDPSSLLILRDCKDSGSLVVKATNGGTILIDNGNLVV